MGCHSSKDGTAPAKKKKKSAEIKDIKLDHTSVHSFDDFLNKSKSVLKEFADLIEPYEDARDRFIDQTWFWRYKDATIKHATKGFLLSMSAMCHSDPSKMKFEFDHRAPFIDFKAKGTDANLDGYFDAFVGFAKAL